MPHDENDVGIGHSADEGGKVVALRAGAADTGEAESLTPNPSGLFSEYTRYPFKNSSALLFITNSFARVGRPRLQMSAAYQNRPGCDGDTFGRNSAGNLAAFASAKRRSRSRYVGASAEPQRALLDLAWPRRACREQCSARVSDDLGFASSSATARRAAIRRRQRRRVAWPAARPGLVQRRRRLPAAARRPAATPRRPPRRRQDAGPPAPGRAMSTCSGSCRAISWKRALASASRPVLSQSNASFMRDTMSLGFRRSDSAKWCRASSRHRPACM